MICWIQLKKNGRRQQANKNKIKFYFDLWGPSRLLSLSSSIHQHFINNSIQFNQRHLIDWWIDWMKLVDWIERRERAAHQFHFFHQWNWITFYNSWMASIQPYFSFTNLLFSLFAGLLLSFFTSTQRQNKFSLWFQWLIIDGGGIAHSSSKERWKES